MLFVFDNIITVIVIGSGGKTALIAGAVAGIVEYVPLNILLLAALRICAYIEMIFFMKISLSIWFLLLYFCKLEFVGVLG